MEPKLAVGTALCLAFFLLLATQACRTAATPEAAAPAPAEEEQPPARSETTAAEWWRGAVFYEIFVRSFADSDGDGIGDLAGLTAKLDYLNDGDPATGSDLGVDALWLMPIYPSPSYHGYDVTDYRDVNADYGTLADLDALLAAAEKRGIRVILDFVLNHSSSEHPWFTAARKDPASPFRDFYSWRSEAPDWKRPWDGAPVWHAAPGGAFYFGLFWEGMPDLNLANPKVQQEMLGAMGAWLDRGVAGFRIDAARHLFESADGVLADQPESHALIKRFRAALTEAHPAALLVAEAWSDVETVATYRGKGDEYQLAFSFDVAGAIKGSVRDGSRAGLAQTLKRCADAYPSPEARAFQAPFLANHDMERVMRTLGGDRDKARLAAALLMAMPGTPFLYYGEEIGMKGGPGPRDEDKRTPMRWKGEGPGFGFTSAAKTWYGEASEPTGVDVASQQADPDSLWHAYRELIALRHGSAALRLGSTSKPGLDGGGRGAFALLRAHGGERVVLVANLYGEPTGRFTVSASGTPRVLLARGLSGKPSGGGEGSTIEDLGPRGFAFLALE